MHRRSLLCHYRGMSTHRTGVRRRWLSAWCVGCWHTCGGWWNHSILDENFIDYYFRVLDVKFIPVFQTKSANGSFDKSTRNRRLIVTSICAELSLPDNLYTVICMLYCIKQTSKMSWCTSVAARGEIGREGCEISSLVEHMGLSPWLFL